MRVIRRQPSEKCTPVIKKSSSLFQPGAKLIVRQAPLFVGLVGVQKPFQRPFQKRRNHAADLALRRSSLGQRRRMDGMAKLLARAGRGLHFKAPERPKERDEFGSDCSDDEEEEEKEDRPFEPLLLWRSPHNEGVEPKGLPPKLVKEMRPDEHGIEEEVTVVRAAPKEAYSKQDVFVPPALAKWLRPHQREGVLFMYQCVMGLRNFKGNGCILADDMGLGKTLQSVSLIYTLLKTSITASGEATAKRVIVVCPCSLVKNWANEFVKWLGPNAVKVMALAEGDRKTIESNIDSFVKTKINNILVASYECIRTHAPRMTKYKDCCDLLVCDEAHRLKNSDNQTSRALNSLPVKRRVLLTGTPMQNDLTEFYAMVDFTNPGILGTPEEFRRKMLFPILRGREPDATDEQKRKMMQIQNDMSTIVNDFILRRVNTLNAQHLPPKLVQVVCCNLTEIQQNMYQHLVNSKDMQHVLDGKQVNCLSSIQMLMKLCNHPSLIAEEDPSTKPGGARNGRSCAKKIKYSDDDDKPSTAAPGADGVAKFLPFSDGGGRNGGPVHPEWSGKMFVLYRLMKEMRKPGNGNDKIVIISNYTQTLDLIGRMCQQNTWGFCRLDGSISMKKRQKMVDEFNDPSSPLVAFLLSSKAGGCGLNLIGGNRLVLFDPDWNPAVDKQAAARCWRDGQKKRCFTYRFLATGTVEEKIFQRQLSKEGLQSVVDDKEQVNALSTKELRNLFQLRTGTPSDTHDKLRCDRCKIIQDGAEMEALNVLPRQLDACRSLLEEMCQQPEAAMFLKTLNPTEHGKTKEEYESLVKQPMDFQVIRKRLEPCDDPSKSYYKKVSEFAKDVNRIFSNVVKVWEPEQDAIADASRSLQCWWLERWTELVPVLLSMKSEDEEKKEKHDGGDVLDCCANVHNERGEDYQEQIGMPDEENMRNWSHHHTTDTVDDPIFRAAMRGCDAVSFVFGLEVTWSLIQERQQEEEERQAMEELGAVQELNEDGGDEDVNKNGEEDEKADEDGEDGEEDENKASAFIVDTDDDDDNGESSPEKKTGCSLAVDSSDEEDSVGERKEENQLNKENTAQLASETQSSTEYSQPGAGEWVCSSCTMRNKKSRRKCVACCTNRFNADHKHLYDESSPGEKTVCSLTVQEISVGERKEVKQLNKENAAPLASETQSSMEYSQPGPDEWECSICTMHNKKSRRKCIACGTNRSNAGHKRPLSDVVS